MESWKYDGMESWKHAWITDQMEAWMNGIMEIWCNGIMEAWPFWNQFRSYFKVIFGDLETRFGDILEARRPDEARWGLEGSRTILTGKTHAIVRVTPISLQSGKPRTLKHCKNTCKMSIHFRAGGRSPPHWPYSPPGPLQPRAVWGIFGNILMNPARPQLGFFFKL